MFLLWEIETEEQLEREKRELKWNKQMSGEKQWNEKSEELNLRRWKVICWFTGCCGLCRLGNGLVLLIVCVPTHRRYASWPVSLCVCPSNQDHANQCCLGFAVWDIHLDLALIISVVIFTKWIGFAVWYVSHLFFSLINEIPINCVWTTERPTSNNSQRTVRGVMGGLELKKWRKKTKESHWEKKKEGSMKVDLAF